MTTQQNQIKYPLSPACYAHSKYVHFLQTSNLSNAQKMKIHEIHAKFMRGTRLSTEQQIFVDSNEYNHAVHQLDVESGEYYKLLKKTAKQLFIKKGLMKESDFDVSPSHSKMHDLYIDFFEKSKEFATFNVSTKAFYYLTLAEVESEYFSQQQANKEN